MFGKSVSSSHPRAGHSGSCKRVSSAQDESQQQQQSFQASHHLRGSSSAGPSSMARPIPAWPAPCQQAKNGEVEGSCQVSALPESRDHIHIDTHTHTHTHTHTCTCAYPTFRAKGTKIVCCVCAPLAFARCMLGTVTTTDFNTSQGAACWDDRQHWSDQ